MRSDDVIVTSSETP